MRLGFVIYGSLNTLTGGYIYDRPKWNNTMESIHRFLTGLVGSIR